MDRGERVLQILQDTCLKATQHDGVWPEKLPVDDLVYTRPEKMPADQIGWMLSPTVVLHESLKDHPEGVWVGYADAHMEFVADAKALEAALKQIEIARRVHAIEQAHPVDFAAHPLPARKLTIRVMDPDGKPAAGVWVGRYVRFGDMFPNDCVGWYGKAPNEPILVTQTDSDGRAVVGASSAFRIGHQESLATLIALDEQRGWVAMEPVRLDEFADGSPTHTIRRRVHCTISSVGLRAFGRAITRTIGDVLFEAGSFSFNACSFQADCKGPYFDLLLPSGDYDLCIRGTDSFAVHRYIRIEPGQRELNLSIDLEAPYPVVQKFLGRPAPKLTGIKAWSGGHPIRLSDLRGRVVILEFWGYWCGPCVASMPHLMQLYDELHPRGLEVIAIHDNSVGSFEELDGKLARTRREIWKGRGLPFPAAIDGGEGKAAGEFRGTVISTYGVQAFPATLLIDRQGRLVEQLDLGNPRAREEILKLLPPAGEVPGERPPATSH